jgi:hypothetical protein
MKGLPEDVELSSLVGEQVLQLCFGSNQVQIHFGDQRYILIEGDCVMHEAGGIPTRLEAGAAASSPFIRLVGRRVLSARRMEDGGLRLQCSEGIELSLLNDSEAYESFQVHLPGRTYVA